MIGHKFNSGAVCVAIAPSEFADDYIILSVWSDQFVVAHIRPDQVIQYHREGPTGGEWWGGHYYDDLPAAVETFVSMTKIHTDQRLLVNNIQRLVKQLGMFVPKYLWEPETVGGHKPFCAQPGVHGLGSHCAASIGDPPTMEGKPSKAWHRDHPDKARNYLAELERVAERNRED